MRVRVGVVALASIALAAPLAAPAMASPAHLARVSATAAAGSHHKVGKVVDFSGGFAAIARTSDLVAVDHYATSIAIRHDGRWVRHAVPNFHFEAASVAAPAAESIFIAGTHFNNGHAHPAIVRWDGSNFTRAQLPATSSYLTEYPDDGGFDSVAASSPADVWAVGASIRGRHGPVALHYNGHKWAEVPTSLCLTSVSASSPTNAFGAGVPCNSSSGSRVHRDIERWNGSSWKRVFTDTEHQDIGTVATSGPRHAYAIGRNAGKPEVLRHVSGSWTRVKLPSGLPTHAHLRAVAARGAAVWVAASATPPDRYSHAFIVHSGGGPLHVQQALPSHQIAAMDARGARVVAIGMDRGFGANHPRLFLDRLHGKRWAADPAPRRIGPMVSFSGISEIAGTNDVVAVGNTRTTGVSAMAIRHNGHWVTKVLPFPHFHPVGVFAPTAHSISIAGSHSGGRYEPFPMVVRWNGTRFINERLPHTAAYDTEDDGSGYLQSISASGPDDIWASGSNLYGHQQAKPHEVSVALHYDGTNWSKRVLPEPMTKIVPSSPTNAFAVAVHRDSGGAYDIGVERWDGTSWKRVYSEYRRETINAVATSGPKQAYAVGTYRGKLEVMRYRPAAKGNDSKRWPTLHLPASLPMHPTLRPTAVAMKGHSVWVLVNTRPGHGRDRQGFILHSNGGPLKVQQALKWPYILRTLNVSGGEVIAAGRTASGGTPIIDRLKGSTWHVKALST